MQSSRTLEVKGQEVPQFKVPVNKFVARHPVTDGALRGEMRVHSGVLERADPTDAEIAGQFSLLAENFNDILLHAADDTLKREACSSVIETVVRLQNPRYATDQVEVRAEAARMKRAFIDQEIDAREIGSKASGPIDFSADPSRELLEDFEIYVTGQYDLRAMRREAAETLAPMIKPSVAEAFADETGVTPGAESYQAPSRFRRAFGAVVARLTVGFDNATTA